MNEIGELGGHEWKDFGDCKICQRSGDRSRPEIDCLEAQKWEDWEGKCGANGWELMEVGIGMKDEHDFRYFPNSHEVKYGEISRCSRCKLLRDFVSNSTIWFKRYGETRWILTNLSAKIPSCRSEIMRNALK